MVGTGGNHDGDGIAMNATFIAPFAQALFTALQDDTHTGTSNLLALVYDESEDDAPRIFPNRPIDPASSFVVIDYPFGGAPGPAYIHGENGDAVAHWNRLQASVWANEKFASLQIFDAFIQAIDGRDICVSEWGSVRLFMRGAPFSLVDEISEIRMYGVCARYEILLLS